MGVIQLIHIVIYHEKVLKFLKKVLKIWSLLRRFAFTTPR